MIMLDPGGQFASAVETCGLDGHRWLNATSVLPLVMSRSLRGGGEGPLSDR